MARKQKPTPKGKKRFVALYSKQMQFLQSDARILAFCAGLGAGKSRCGATRILLRARNGEDHLCLSPSYVMLKKSTLALMITVAKELDVLKKVVMSPYPIVRFQTQDGGEACATFGSVDRPDSVRGSNNDSLWLDEASYMPQEALHIGMGRLRGIRGQMGTTTMTFTPRGRSNWTFGTFFEKSEITPDSDEDAKELGLHKFGPSWYRTKPNTEIIRAATYENPFISEEFYEALQDQYSQRFAAQELLADFIEFESLIFAREWFANKIREVAPREARRVRYWDLAASEMSGCYTCGTMLAMTQDKQVYVESVVRGQWSALTRNYMIEATAQSDAQKYGNEVTQVIEQEPGSGGKEQVQQMIRMLAGHPVYRDLPSHGQATRSKDGEKLPGNAKVTRAYPFSAQAEAGNVYLVRGDWNDEWLSEITAFPEMKICDQVDSCSAAFNWLCKSHVSDPGELTTIPPHMGATVPPEKFGITQFNAHLEVPTFVGRR